jgi:hypothetical protein
MVDTATAKFIGVGRSAAKTEYDCSVVGRKHLRHLQVNSLPMSSVTFGIIKRVCGVCVCVYVGVCV